METSALSVLEKTLSVTFQNPALIQQAFIHRSYLNEAKKKIASNERLEFLGDCILSFIVSEHLFRTYPHFPEGHLTNLRSTLVKTSTLAEIALDLQLGNFLYLSKGEEEGGGRKNASILADTFEAFLGALFLDQGLPAATMLIQTYLLPKLPVILEERLYKDAKSTLQERVQDELKVSPVYTVRNEEGPDHAKEFTIGVLVNNELLAEGKGKSKQEAEQAAARSALEKWQKK